MPSIVDISEVLLQLGLAASSTETERALASQALNRATGAVVSYLKYNPVQATHTEFYPQADFRRSGRQEIWEVNSNSAYVRQLSEFVSNELQIKNLPIRSITSLFIDYDGRGGSRPGSFAAETQKVEGQDFWPNYDGLDSSNNKICRDGIIRSEGVWPDTPGSVKIVYVAGYSVSELHGNDSVIDASPILEAVIDEAVRRFLKVASRSKNRLAGFVGPLTSETLGDYSYSGDSSIFGRLVGGGSDLLPETEQKLANFCRMDLGVM